MSSLVEDLSEVEVVRKRNLVHSWMVWTLLSCPLQADNLCLQSQNYMHHRGSSRS